jgi:hypothetical protein
MKALAIIGTLAVLLVGGAVTVAAAPYTAAPAAQASPSPSATPRPTRKPKATAQPAATAAPTVAPTPASGSTNSNGSSSTGTTAESLSANLQPLDVISGSVALKTNADGTGTLTLDTAGLGGASPWHVYLDPGRVTNIGSAAKHDFAFTSGRDFTMFTSEVATIPLTKAQMNRLNSDLSAAGVVTANITDGIRHSVAYLQ